MKRAIILAVLVSALFICRSNTDWVLADVIDYHAVGMEKQAETVSLRADTIQIMYRSNHGVLQYRRWNQTQNCWVDPDWINF